MHESAEKALSDDAREVVASINGLAAKIMYEHYETLTVGMRLRVSKVIRNTQHILDDEAIQA